MSVCWLVLEFFCPLVAKQSAEILLTERKILLLLLLLLLTFLDLVMYFHYIVYTAFYDTIDKSYPLI